MLDRILSFIADKLPIKQDITPSSISDFITLNSGFTVSSLAVVKYGNILSINFGVKRNTQWEANETGTIGTLKSAYRPAMNSGGASATFRELVGSDGRVYARPATRVLANSAESYSIIYLI